MQPGPTEDCVLDCPKTDKPCALSTCCGPSKHVSLSLHLNYFSNLSVEEIADQSFLQVSQNSLYAESLLMPTAVASCS